MMIDTHCHAQFNAFKDDSDEVIKRSLEKEIYMILVGSQSSTSKRAVEFANKYSSGVWAAVGLHPTHLMEHEVDEEEVNFVSRTEKFDYEYYKQLAQDKKVVAIGEVGLDYYHKPDTISFEELKALQAPNFIEHAKLADEMNLPVIIHCRDAHNDQLGIIRDLISKGGMKKRGVVHCFTGNWQEAKQYVDLGFYIGFTGVIAFPPKKTNPQPSLDILEALKNTPLDRILSETDAPYLTPPPHRGERNEPVYVEFIIQKIAEVKGITVQEAQDATFNNAKRLFELE